MELGSSQGTIPANLEQLASNIRGYSFFRLVPLLTQLAQLDEKNSSWSNGFNKLYFRSSTNIGFPASDIESLEFLTVPDNTEDQAWTLLLTTNFLGVHGVDSPLPTYFLEEALQSSSEEDVMRNFFDFFNNRLIGILYKIWIKYRYYIRYEKNAKDKYSDYVFAFFGAYYKEMRLANVNMNWGKMLAYAGIFSSRCRSPDVLANVISHIFDFSRYGVVVGIESFCFRRVEIPVPQRWKIGKANSGLAHSAIVGSKVPDRSGKFNIVISKLSFDIFKEFLPGQEKYMMLVKLVEFMLKEQFSYDLVLELLSDQAPPFKLQKSDKHRLGWSSFLGGNQEVRSQDQRVVLQVLV